jgi:hypothetical protein
LKRGFYKHEAENPTQEKRVKRGRQKKEKCDAEKPLAKIWERSRTVPNGMT